MDLAAEDSEAVPILPMGADCPSERMAEAPVWRARRRRRSVYLAAPAAALLLLGAPALQRALQPASRAAMFPPPVSFARPDRARPQPPPSRTSEPDHGTELAASDRPRASERASESAPRRRRAPASDRQRPVRIFRLGAIVLQPL